MTKKVQSTIAWIYTILFFVALSLTCKVEAKTKACQSYLDKLRNVQSQQRNSNTGKQAAKLREREVKYRDAWWQCKQGKAKAKVSRKKKPIKKTYTGKQKAPHVTYKTQLSAEEQKEKSPFYTGEPVVIKALYKRVKQTFWNKYYQPGDACIYPRSYKVFVMCVEDKARQSRAFERQYKKEHKAP